MHNCGGIGDLGGPQRDGGDGGDDRRSRRLSVAGHEPPHDLEAEESLLGAMLLRDEAVGAGIATVSAGDFYKPSHVHIFTAMAHLAVRQDPVDPVTVGAELKAMGVLAEVGDPSVLISLQNGVPSPGNAVSYAEIVVTHSRSRARLHQLSEIHQAIEAGDLEKADRLTIELNEIDTGVRPLQHIDIGEIMRRGVPAVRPTLLRRTDGKALVVEGKFTLIFGEPEAGKSWLMTEAIRQTLMQGQNVAMVDYEGDEFGMAERLLELGVPVEAIDAHLRYYWPGGIPPAAIVREIATWNPVLVVVDSLVAILNEHGLDEDKAKDALVMMRAFRPLAHAGAAVTIIDHVTKDKEGRGRWARGSGAKIGEVDATFSLESVRPFARSSGGSSTLRVQKDRWGVIGPRGSVAALVSFEPSLAGRLRVELQPKTPWNMWTPRSGSRTSSWSSYVAPAASSTSTSWRRLCRFGKRTSPTPPRCWPPIRSQASACTRSGTGRCTAITRRWRQQQKENRVERS